MKKTALETICVSVVTPMYNAEAWVERTILSVLAQGHRPMEHIVVDDGSTDRSREVVLRYASRGVRLLKKDNGGVASAFNRGMEAASGDLVAWLDSDNLMLPGSVQAAVNARRACPDAAIIYGDFIKIDEDDRPTALRRQPSFSYNVCLYGYLTITNAPVFMDRRALAATGPLDESITTSADMEPYLRIGRNRRVMHLRRVLGAYRVLPGSISRARASLLEEHTWQLRERYGKHGLSRRDLRRLHTFYKGMALLKMIAEGAIWCRIPPFSRWLTPSALPPGTFMPAAQATGGTLPPDRD